MTDKSDYDDLSQRLFAEATARLEDALLVVVGGQNPRASLDALNAAAEDAIAALEATKRLLEAASVLTDRTTASRL
ncbi:MAG: hypothetical protein RID42_17925 [Alphaproteobacteria bacterium]